MDVDGPTFGTSSDWPTNFSMLASAWSSLGAMNSIVGPPVDRLKVLSFCAPLREDDTGDSRQWGAAGCCSLFAAACTQAELHAQPHDAKHVKATVEMW